MERAAHRRARRCVRDERRGKLPIAVLDNLPVLYGPDAMATSLAELEASAESARLVVAIDQETLAKVPVVIISAGDAPEETRARRTALASRSRGGHHEVASGTTHYIHYQRPERVADTILAVVSSVQ